MTNQKTPMKLWLSPLSGPLMLVVLQILVASFALSSFIFGTTFLAFSDIGGDSYTQMIPAFTHLARELQSGWPSAWTFHYGLGNANSGIPNPFWLVGSAWGPDGVLRSLIWVYLSRLILAGLAFYWLLHLIGYRRPTCIVMALSYSYCGYATVDGQWDSMMSGLVLYPLVLVGTELYLRRGNIWALPLIVALAAYGGAFTFAVGLFLVYACIWRCLLTDSFVSEAKRWLLGVFPLSTLGLALAAPAVLHTVIQILDSPRVTGEQSMSTGLMRLAFAVNEPDVLQAELAAFFHKDLLGIGNDYRGWLNYLEGPMFYVGMLPLILLPQLWTGTERDRRMLMLAATVLTCFIVFPGFRMLTFGFMVPYFRENNLWISLLLLMLAGRALDRVLTVGINRSNLIITAVGLSTVLTIFWLASPPDLIDSAHATKILALIMASTGSLWLFNSIATRPFLQRSLLVAVTVLSAILTTYPSFNTNRKIVTPETISYSELGATAGYYDISAQIISKIRQFDQSPFYRIEKSFLSGSRNDAVVQGYFGVKSYDFHGSAVVRLFIATGLLPKSSETRAYTNWITGFGDRFVLNTLVGVKYMLSPTPLNWPGYSLLFKDQEIHVYSNAMAMPLGVVYHQQTTASAISELSQVAQDLVMLEAAVVESPLPSVTILQPDKIDYLAQAPLDEIYFARASELKQNGMNIEKFSSTCIDGTINSSSHGILALSIPDVPGWSVSIDGKETAILRVNHGFFGVAITPGDHQIQLRFRPPGLLPGLLIMILATILLATLTYYRSPDKKSRQSRHSTHATR